MLTALLNAGSPFPFGGIVSWSRKHNVACNAQRITIVSTLRSRASTGAGRAYSTTPAH